MLTGVDPAALPGWFTGLETPPDDDPPPTAEPVAGAPGDATLVRGLAGPVLRGALLAALGRARWTAVGPSGRIAEAVDGRGPWRATTYDAGFAARLWARLAPLLAPARTVGDLTCDAAGTWSPFGVNSLLRFISYRDGDLIVPHYDSPWEPGDGTTTLSSVVLYLEVGAGVRGGATGFVRDDRAGIPVAARDLTDRPRLAEGAGLLASVDPVPGDALVFDHRVLHQAGRVTAPPGAAKVVLRTDVLYR